MKFIIIAVLALGAGFYFWPKETEKGVNKAVRTVVGTGTGAVKGAVAELKN